VIAGGGDYKPRAKPGICSQAEELKDKSGAYLKTACMVSTSATYANALANCKANGMNLFVIESAAEQTALLDYSGTYFAAYNGPVLWVNGQKDASGKWSTSNPTQALFSGIKWRSGTPTEPGNCLIVNAKEPKTPFSVQPYSCDGAFWYYCEYE
jgi:Lectin C-type domain